MVEDTLEVGSTVEIDSRSRRRFLKSLAVFGTGVTGLTKSIEKVSGKKTEGVPLVHTRDQHGNPAKVRLVPKERRRRIKVLANLPVQQLVENNPIIESIEISQRSNDSSDLAIQFNLSDDDARAKSRLPNRIEDVPVVYGQSDVKETGGHWCSDNDGTERPIEGTVQIGDGNGVGTVTMVGYAGVKDDRHTVMTAHHVMENASTMYQNGDPIADHHYSNQARDVTSYTIKSGISNDIMGIHNSSAIGVSELNGVWTFDGLTDAVSGGTVPCTLSGNQCKIENECNATKRSGDRVEYEAAMKYERAIGGDSGAPWVDDDGYLLAMHSGWVQDYTLNKWDVGTVGDDAVRGAQALPSQDLLWNTK